MIRIVAIAETNSVSSSERIWMLWTGWREWSIARRSTRPRQSAKVIAETDPVGGRRAVVAGDQRGPAVAAPAARRHRIPGPAEIADPVPVREAHHLVDVAVSAVGLAKLSEHHWIAAVNRDDRRPTGGVARAEAAVGVVVGDELMSRIARRVRDPTGKIQRPVDPAEQQRLGGAGVANRVEQLLHARRAVGGLSVDLAARPPAAPSDPVRFVVEV